MASPSKPDSTTSLLSKWIKGGANATLFLSSMSKPRHGKLDVSSDDKIWYFYPGRTNQGILLPDFNANCHDLLDTAQLFRGHAKFKNVYDARTQLSLRDCMLRHVSAHGLTSLIALSSLKHHAKMSPEDKAIWGAAYDEEYDGGSLYQPGKSLLKNNINF